MFTGNKKETILLGRPLFLKILCQLVQNVILIE